MYHFECSILTVVYKKPVIIVTSRIESCINYFFNFLISLLFEAEFNPMSINKHYYKCLYNAVTVRVFLQKLSVYLQSIHVEVHINIFALRFGGFKICNK